jgi:hypothetical protein
MAYADGKMRVSPLIQGQMSASEERQDAWSGNRS